MIGVLKALLLSPKTLQVLVDSNNAGELRQDASLISNYNDLTRFWLEIAIANCSSTLGSVLCCGKMIFLLHAASWREVAERQRGKRRSGTITHVF